MSPASGIDRLQCDGLCVDSGDIGVPGYGIVYPHPGCPVHDPIPASQDMNTPEPERENAKRGNE